MNARFVLPWLMDFAQYEMLLTENVAHHAPKLEVMRILQYTFMFIEFHGVAQIITLCGFMDCS